MSTHTLFYFFFVSAIAAFWFRIDKRYRGKLTEYIPPIVALYFTTMLLSTFGVWHHNAATTEIYKTIKNILLPAMIFLMLLRADLRLVSKLGVRLSFTFFLASFSIAVGFIVTFALLHDRFDADAAKAFGALCASWMGGTANMVAVQNALDLSDSALGYTLLIDSIDYTLWVMFLLALVPFAARFNRMTHSDTDRLRRAITAVESETKTPHKHNPFAAYTILLLTALFVSWLSHRLAYLLPISAFWTHTTWTVVIATLLGIFAAQTPLGKFAESSTLANASLYLLVAFIASRADFHQLTQAPLYIAAGLSILAIHALLMVLFAKWFRLDLFSIALASLANIGGIASAPILASAYHPSLVPVGVVMALLGYMVGTFGGLGVAMILQAIAA